MKRYYIFKWYENTTNWGGKGFIERTNRINLTAPVGKVEVDAKRAVDLFVRGFGNLKKNTIISIKEFDENDQQIGEDIVPSGDSIIPVKK